MSRSKSGPTSFGYQRRDGKLIAHPEEAPIRRRIFELFAEHQRKKTVAEILNAEGAKTRNGAHFSGQTIGRLLQEEAVIGIPGEVEQLVSKELFERCQALLAAQTRDGGAKRKVVHLFAGYVFCSCGGKMYVPSNAQKYICGDCRTKIPTDDLEAVYCSQLPTELKAQMGKTELRYKWNGLPFDTKREIIECVTHRIEIDDNNVTCCFFAL